MEKETKEKKLDLDQLKDLDDAILSDIVGGLTDLNNSDIIIDKYGSDCSIKGSSSSVASDTIVIAGNGKIGI